jgi:hypothetical protein
VTFYRVGRGSGKRPHVKKTGLAHKTAQEDLTDVAVYNGSCECGMPNHYRIGIG